MHNIRQHSNGSNGSHGSRVIASLALLGASLLPLAAHADVVIPAGGFMSLSSGGLRAH